MNLPSQHWTISYTNTLPSSVINQPPTFIPPNFQAPYSQPARHPYTFNIPVCAAIWSHIQTFAGTDYQCRLENFLIGAKACTIYQFEPKPTNSEQYRICNLRKKAFDVTSIDSPV